MLDFASSNSTISTQRGYLPLGAYAIIGDCRTAALVGDDASIDWCCLPDFDSHPVLSRIIGAPRGGYLALTEPESGVSPTAIRQAYLPDTAILTTEVQLATGRLLVTDFMPMHGLLPLNGHGDDPCIVRQITALEGECHFAVTFKVAPDYGRTQPRMTVNDEGVIAAGGSGVVVLSYADGNAEGAQLENPFTGPFSSKHVLRPGERLTVVLGWAQHPHLGSRLRRAFRRDWHANFDATRHFWEDWTAHGT